MVTDAYAKNRKQSVVSLRKDTTTELQVFFAGKMVSVQAFNVPERTAEMIRADLEDANIPYVDNGFFFDFHAQRHETSTLLAASGVHPKTAQSHMRHSDINLTMTAYGHTLTGQEAAAVEAMPDLSLPSKQQKVIATGTDGKAADTAESSSKELTPKLTPTAYSKCNELASSVGSSSVNSARAVNHKHLEVSKLDTKRKPLSPIGININGEGGIQTRSLHYIL